MTLDEEIRDLWFRWNELYDKRPKTPDDILEKNRIGELLDEAYKRHEKPLIDEVLKAGIRIKSVWDFVNTADRYAEAIPILIKHLSCPYDRRTKEGIVRALAVKEAKGLANKEIIEEYHKAPNEDHHFRWAFGNTMSVIVTKDDLDELIEIVTDESNGESRTGFIEALAKIKSPKVIEVLHQLENDKNQIVADRAKKILAKKTKAAERKTKKKKP